MTYTALIKQVEQSFIGMAEAVGLSLPAMCSTY